MSSAACAGGDLLCLGPLTNVAHALARGADVRTATVMGGNRLGEEDAEFNFASDPAAAAAVVAGAAGLAVVGLDACDPALDDAAAPLGRGASALASLYRADAYAARCDPVAAFRCVRADAFEEIETPAAVDACKQPELRLLLLRPVPRFLLHELVDGARQSQPLRHDHHAGTTRSRPKPGRDIPRDRPRGHA